MPLVGVLFWSWIFEASLWLDVDEVEGLPLELRMLCEKSIEKSELEVGQTGVGGRQSGTGWDHQNCSGVI